MKIELYMCDTKGHQDIRSFQRVNIDLEDGGIRSVDLCLDCTARGLQVLLNTLQPVAQQEWLAKILGEMP